MSIELFLKLKEIDSLTRMNTSSTKALKDQELRIQSLNNKRQDAASETVSLRNEILKLKSCMDDIELKISSHLKQISHIEITNPSSPKLEIFKNEVSQLEDEGLNFLSQIDEHESKIQELQGFLNGLSKTIEEIASESQPITHDHQLQIRNGEFRINLLLNELPKEFKDNYSKINLKRLAHGPFTRVDQSSCFFCRYKLSRLEESEIDMLKNLKNCPQCERIFLPFGV